ncbi:19538_t:CDS:2, partial [Gigaspora margarita]
AIFDNLKYTEYYEQYILYPYKQQDIHEDDFLEQEKDGVLRKIQLSNELSSKLTLEQLKFYGEVIAYILWQQENTYIPVTKFSKFLDRKADHMANKAILDCIDLFLRQICNKNELFRRKPFIGVGDFRQVAPVVKEAGKSATIDASIKTSHLWTHFDKYVLNQLIHNANDPEFAYFVDAIGNN